MKALQAIKSELKSMDLGAGPIGKSKVAGVLGVAVATGVEYGAGYAIGQCYHRYGAKKLPRTMAIIGKLGAVGLQMMGAPHLAVSSLAAVGSAGVAALGL